MRVVIQLITENNKVFVKANRKSRVVVPMINHLRILQICLCLLLWICSYAQATEYKLHVLSKPRDYYKYNFAQRINSSGQVLGFSGYSYSDTTYNVYQWDDSGTHRLGYSGTYRVVGLNDNGEAVYGCYLWKNNTQSTLPGLVSGSTSNILTDINNNGTVAGFSSANIPAYWDAAGIHALVLPAGCTAGQAWAINESGGIAGNVTDDRGKCVPAVWNGNSVTLLHNLPDYDHSKAVSLNDLNQVVGNSDRWRDVWTGSSWYHMMQTGAFIWKDEKLTEIGLAGRNNYSMQVNNKGQVAGYSYNLNLAIDYKAWVWDNGTITELPGLGSESIAHGVNDDGWIAGQAWLDGTSYAVMWEPMVPEPSSLLTLAAGLGAGVCFVRRRRS